MPPLTKATTPIAEHTPMPSVLITFSPISICSTPVEESKMFVNPIVIFPI